MGPDFKPQGPSLHGIIIWHVGSFRGSWIVGAGNTAVLVKKIAHRKCCIPAAGDVFTPQGQVDPVKVVDVIPGITLGPAAVGHPGVLPVQGPVGQKAPVRVQVELHLRCIGHRFVGLKFLFLV